MRECNNNILIVLNILKCELKEGIIIQGQFVPVVYLLRVSLTGSTYLWGTPRGGEYPSG